MCSHAMSHDLFEVRTGFCHELLRLDCIRVRYPRAGRASLGKRPRAAATAAHAGARRWRAREGRTGRRRCDGTSLTRGRGDGAGRSRSARGRARRRGGRRRRARSEAAANAQGAHGACGSAGEEVLPPRRGRGRLRGHHGRGCDRRCARARARAAALKPPRARALARSRACVRAARSARRVHACGPLADPRRCPRRPRLRAAHR